LFGRKVLILICVLYVVGLTGCAAGWFIAGAGTAATVATLAHNNAEQEQEQDDIK